MSTNKIWLKGHFKALGGPRQCGNHWKGTEKHANYDPNPKQKHFRYVRITFGYFLDFSFGGLSALRAPRRGHNSGFHDTTLKYLQSSGPYFHLLSFY